jgi:ubiquinol-cytochrome c reductase iron-sulfur subunit
VALDSETILDQEDKDIKTNSNRRKFLSIATSVTSVVGILFATIPFISSFQPNKKAKALGAAIKIDVSKLEAGSILKVIWRGQPIWVLRRSEGMLKTLQKKNLNLTDPESEMSVQPNFAQNKFRSLKPEFFIVEGVCTHLGCAPIEKLILPSVDMGSDWEGGFYCPCHGSKFDLSGRVFSGFPAPANLRVPPHRYQDENTVIIGESEEIVNG